MGPHYYDYGKETINGAPILNLIIMTTVSTSFNPMLYAYWWALITVTTVRRQSIVYPYCFHYFDYGKESNNVHCDVALIEYDRCLLK